MKIFSNCLMNKQSWQSDTPLFSLSLYSPKVWSSVDPKACFSFPLHLAFKIFAVKTKQTKTFKINVFPQDVEQMLLHSKGKNSGTTNYRSSTEGTLNKSLFLTGILGRKTLGNSAPTNPPGPQCFRVAMGQQVESRRAHPVVSYLQKGFGLKPVNGKNQA